MSDGETAILGKLADVAQHQAVTTERLISVLERVDTHLTQADHERDRAVLALKEHFSGSMARSDGWWKRAFLIAVALIILSNLLDVALSRYLPFLKP